MDNSCGFNNATNLSILKHNIFISEELFITFNREWKKTTKNKTEQYLFQNDSRFDIVEKLGNFNLMNIG